MPIRTLKALIIVSLLLSFLGLPGCVQPGTKSASEAVIVISWDGGRADVIYGLMEEGLLLNFAAVAKRGLRAEYALSVDPPLTAAAQNSISTGSYPAHTGIVSNAFHNPADNFYWYRRGYDELLDQAKPVWVTASRARLTTAALFFVGGSPQHPGQTADYTIGYGTSDAYSRQESVSLEPLAEAWDGDPPASYRPPYEGAYDIPEVSNIYLYVLDSSDDGTANYDTVILNTARSLDENAVQLRVGEWGQMVLLPRINAGAEFLIQEISPGQAPDQITLYHTGVYHNSAAPRELLDALNQEFGFFPFGADYYALEHGWITPEQNLHLLERASLWMAEVTAWVYQAYQPDLLFTWQDGFDTAGHSFSMNDPRQINYSPENLTSYQGYYRQAIQISD